MQSVTSLSLLSGGLDNLCAISSNLGTRRTISLRVLRSIGYRVKRLLFVALLVISSTTAYSQQWRVAPTFSMNASWINYSSAMLNNLNSSTFSAQPGPVLKLQIGALLDYKFSDRFSIRSGLVYTGKGGGLTFNLSQYGVAETVRGGYDFGYLDVPLLLNFSVGQNDWRVVVGATAGIALNAQGKLEGRSISGYGYYQGNSTNFSIGSGAGQVQPFDLASTLGIVKELSIDDRPLEVGLYGQHSFSKWNSSATINPALYARHSLVGLRVAYFFDIRR